MGKWYKGYRSSERKRLVENRILTAIPEEPKEIRMSDLIRTMKGTEPSISAPTVCKRLDEFVEKGIVRRIIRSHKDVSYQKAKSTFELLMLELEEKLDQILKKEAVRPVKYTYEDELSKLWKEAHDRFASAEEREKAFNEFREKMRDYTMTERSAQNLRRVINCTKVIHEVLFKMLPMKALLLGGNPYVRASEKDGVLQLQFKRAEQD